MLPVPKNLALNLLPSVLVGGLLTLTLASNAFAQARQPAGFSRSVKAPFALEVPKGATLGDTTTLSDWTASSAVGRPSLAKHLLIGGAVGLATVGTVALIVHITDESDCDGCSPIIYFPLSLIGMALGTTVGYVVYKVRSNHRAATPSRSPS